MDDPKRSAIVISASSNIGCAACERWATRGWNLVGTYRTGSNGVRRLQKLGVRLVHCDLALPGSITHACDQLSDLCSEWDVLMICPATMKPIAPFLQCDFDNWEESININFTRQMRIAHALLPMRRQGSSRLPIVILFAGPGTNSAWPSYSAEVVGKLAQYKMCELLDAEIPDARFVIVGPGFVKTKIHKETIEAGEIAGTNLERTLFRLVLSQLGFGNCLRKRLRLLPFFRSVDVGGWQPWDENGMWSGWKGKNETSWND